MPPRTEQVPMWQSTGNSFSGFYTPPEQGGDKLLVSIVDSIPACHAGDTGSIPRRGYSACAFTLLRRWAESKKSQEESQLHWPGIEPGPPAWQARILPLNHQCAPHTETNGQE